MKTALRSILAIVAGLGLASHVHAASIVSYENPVATADIGVMELSGCDLADSTEVINGTFHVSNWTPATPVMSSAVNANYLSHPLYAIAQAGAEGVTKDWTSSRLLDGAIAGSYDIQWIVKDSVPDEVIAMSLLQYVKAEDFVSATGGEPLSELSVTFLDNETEAEGALRFAVKNAGQWYVSAANDSAGAGILTLSNPQDANQWGAITPATSSSDVIVTPVGVTFDTAGSALTSIEAIGFYFDAIDTPVGGRVRVRVSNFTADTAGGSPETDSARVLAFNVDAEKADFEYVSPKIGFNLSLSAALDGVVTGGSTNESYGTFFDDGGALASPDNYPWQANGANSLVADVTITNTSSQSLKLDGLYFDLNRVAETAVRQIKLDYISGDLGAAGTVYDITLDTTAAINIWKWCDLTLTSPGDVTTSPALGFNAMSDVVLGVNETATFRLTLQSSSDAATEPDEMILDNIALIGDFFTDDVLVDWGNPDMFFGFQGTELLNLGANNSVTNGDLFIRNYNPTSPLFDRGEGGFYQAQDVYGIMQSGNQGVGAEDRPFRYAKLGDGSSTEGNLFMTVTPAGDVANGTTTLQSTIVYYRAEDFYDSIEAGEGINSLEMNLVELKKDAGHVRFAVKDSGQWYASFTKATAAGPFSMGFPSAENAWGALSTATSGSSTMMTDAGIVFDTAGVSFTNVEAVGFFVEITGGTEANLSFNYDSFKVLTGPPPPVPDSSVLAYNVDAVVTDFEYVKSGVDFTLSFISDGNNPGTTDGSLDGSLGSFYDPNSANTNNMDRPWAGRGDNPLNAIMTIENIRPDSLLELDGFYFDLYRSLPGAVRRVDLQYIGGDLDGVSSGLVYSVTMNTDEFVPYLETNGVGEVTEIIPWADFDWTFATEGNTPSVVPATFNAMADISLAYGESATFRYDVITSTDMGTEPNQTRMDNIAFRGTLRGIGYASWITGFGLSTNDYPEGADPDGDGLDNLYEYGLDGNPNDSGNTGTSPTYNMSVGGVFTYVYPKRTELGNGLTYYLELTDNLIYTPWSNSGYTVMGTDVTGGTLDFVTNEVSTATKDEQFIRLIIEQL